MAHAQAPADELGEDEDAEAGAGTYKWISSCRVLFTRNLKTLISVCSNLISRKAAIARVHHASTGAVMINAIG
jgi:hypothetical protein